MYYLSMKTSNVSCLNEAISVTNETSFVATSGAAIVDVQSEDDPNAEGNIEGDDTPTYERQVEKRPANYSLRERKMKLLETNT